MANFVISRARRLFSYSDLGGSNGSAMDLEASSTTVTEVKGFVKQRKKCILVSTGFFGLMVVIIIGKLLASDLLKKGLLFLNSQTSFRGFSGFKTCAPVSFQIDN